MALSFTSASTNKVTVTNPQTLGSGSAFTAYAWFYKTAGNDSTGTTKGGIDVFVTIPSISFEIFTEIPRATTTAQAVGGVGALPENVWTFLASTYDETDGPRLFRGTLSAAVAEISYSTRTVGAGATNADSGDLWINNRSAASSLAWGGRFGVFAWYDRRMTLGELQSHQFRPHKASGCQFFGILGHNGATNVPDLSGNGRTGTISGATVADHAPLPPLFGLDAGQSYVLAGQPYMARVGGVPGMRPGRLPIGRGW